MISTSSAVAQTRGSLFDGVSLDSQAVSGSTAWRRESHKISSRPLPSVVAIQGAPLKTSAIRATAHSTTFRSGCLWPVWAMREAVRSTSETNASRARSGVVSCES